MSKKSEMTDNVVRVDFIGRSKSKLVQDETLSEKKREIFSSWLKNGTVCLLFDARKEDVKVPLEFSNQGDLRLNFSYNFDVPDFNFNQVGVWATLSFDSGEHFCMVPWTSIYGMQSSELNQGAVWFESFPKDYDQEEVLGFTESMCQTPLDNHNVVEFLTSEEK